MCKVCGAGHQAEEEPGVLARFQVGNPSKSGLDSQLLLINLLNLSFLICRKRTRPCTVAELTRDDAYRMCHAQRALSIDSNYCCNCFQKASWVCRAQHNGQGRPSDSRKYQHGLPLHAILQSWSLYGLPKAGPHFHLLYFTTTHPSFAKLFCCFWQRTPTHTLHGHQHILCTDTNTYFVIFFYDIASSELKHYPLF